MSQWFHPKETRVSSISWYSPAVNYRVKKLLYGVKKLPTPESELVRDKYESKLRGRKGELSGREGARYAHAGFPGGWNMGRGTCALRGAVYSLKRGGDLPSGYRSKCQRGESHLLNEGLN